MKKEGLRTFEVSYTLTFTREVVAKDPDYADQKARHQVRTMSAAELVQGATGMQDPIVHAVRDIGPATGAARTLHGTRDTGWPRTAGDHPTAGRLAHHPDQPHGR